MSGEGDDARATREAAEWLARLNSRAVTTEDLNTFYEWRRVPANAAAYARGEQVWHDARGLGDDRDIALAVRAALERPRQEQGRRVTRRLVLAGGGGAVLVAVGGAWWLGGRALEYRTGIGEQLVVHLDDGSRLRLDTDSAVSMRFSRSRRAVDVLGGRAMFEVARDVQRPFEVRGAGFAVEALGTTFEVSAIADRPACVLLVEGRVVVNGDDGAWRQLLAHAGDSLSINAGEMPVLGREDIARATSWTSGRLVFRDTPLGEAIAEINRYSRTRIALSVRDPAGFKVDGAFEAGDTASFVAAVTAIFPLRARAAASGDILLTDM